MTTDTQQAGIGAVLLLASTAVLLSTGVQGISVPSALGSVAALGMAAGALLFGMSERDAAV